MNAKNYLLVGVSALTLTVMSVPVSAEWTGHKALYEGGEEEVQEETIAIEDLEDVEYEGETLEIVDAGEDGELAITIETVDTVSDTVETGEHFGTTRRGTTVVGSVGDGLTAREHRADREQVLSRSDDNMCYHAPFESLAYCQSWLKAN